MRTRMLCFLTAALLATTPTIAFPALAPYSQDFESMSQADPNALSADGWQVFGNAYSSTFTYLYGYGPFPAPNPGGGFSAVDAGQGGAAQGLQQLSVYSDYNNTGQGSGQWIESNVYREQTVGAGDVGRRWRFRFDAKLGNLVTPTTAAGFIKTLNPAAGFALTNFIQADMTNIPATWSTYSVEIDITPLLVGQLLQIGFVNTTTNYVGSGVFYDNLSFEDITGLDAPSGARPAVFELRAPSPNPSPGAARIEYSLAREGDVELAVLDVAGRRVTTLVSGARPAGPHATVWDGRDASGRRAAPGVYRALLRTADGVRTRTLVLTR